MLQARRGLTGIMNYTNPGAISHNEILELYKSYIDHDFSWKNFSLEEQAKVIIAPRSNNLLDTARVSAYSSHSSLQQLCPILSSSADSHESVGLGRRARRCCPGRTRLKRCATDFGCGLMLHALAQIEGEFPEILGIRESLIKHVFEPAAQQVCLRTLPLPLLSIFHGSSALYALAFKRLCQRV